MYDFAAVSVAKHVCYAKDFCTPSLLGYSGLRWVNDQLSGFYIGEIVGNSTVFVGLGLLVG